ncbi:uncharacterized protein LOC141890289 isoform X2 [Acropora palmata]|uniref:uncharacterized protein LOC141890289 isoform X2 n=1 Tax=Acropora palmata TaxID=6131 RepID=UPI003DA0F038
MNFLFGLVSIVVRRGLLSIVVYVKFQVVYSSFSVLFAGQDKIATQVVECAPPPTIQFSNESVLPLDQKACQGKKLCEGGVETRLMLACPVHRTPPQNARKQRAGTRPCIRA